VLLKGNAIAVCRLGLVSLELFVVEFVFLEAKSTIDPQSVLADCVPTVGWYFALDSVVH
jgi:hypothetical protein